MRKLISVLSCALTFFAPLVAWATINCGTNFTATPLATYYANATTGSDPGNTCTSDTYPCTFQGALSAAELADLTGTTQNVLVALDAGTYNGQITLNGLQPSAVSAAAALGSPFIGIYGNGAVGSVILTDTTAGDAGTIIVSDGAKVGLCNLVVSSKYGSAVFPVRNSYVWIDQNMSFKQSHFGILHSETGSVIETHYGFTVDATGISGVDPCVTTVGSATCVAPAIFQARLGGRIEMDEINQAITLTNTPAWLQFADVEDTSVVYIPAANISFSGSGLGPQYFVNEGGEIQTNNASGAFLPGGDPGQFLNTGVYYPPQTPTAGTPTGIGTTGTETFQGGSYDKSFTINLSPNGTGVGSSGNAIVNFATTFNYVTCSPPVLFSGGTAWAAGSTASITALSKTGMTIAWNNNGTVLSGGGTHPYYIMETCGN